MTANHHEACGVCHQAPCACPQAPIEPGDVVKDIVTHEEAEQIALAYIDKAFGNAEKPGRRLRHSIPADPRGDTDLRLMAYIKQQRRRAVAVESSPLSSSATSESGETGGKDLTENQRAAQACPFWEEPPGAQKESSDGPEVRRDSAFREGNRRDKGGLHGEAQPEGSRASVAHESQSSSQVGGTAETGQQGQVDEQLPPVSLPPTPETSGMRAGVGEVTHGGAGGGDEDGYDMTGASGPTTHRDVRNYFNACNGRFSSAALAMLLLYVDRQEAAGREAARLRRELSEAQDLRAWSKDGDSAALADVAAERDALRSDLARLTSELEQAVREREELKSCRVGLNEWREWAMALTAPPITCDDDLRKQLAEAPCSRDFFLSQIGIWTRKCFRARDGWDNAQRLINETIEFCKEHGESPARVVGQRLVMAVTSMCAAKESDPANPPSLTCSANCDGGNHPDPKQHAINCPKSEPAPSANPPSATTAEAPKCAHCGGNLPEPVQVYMLARPNALGLQFCRKGCARDWQDDNPMPITPAVAVAAISDAFPTSAADEAVVDGLMAKRAERPKVTPMRTLEPIVEPWPAGDAGGYVTKADLAAFEARLVAALRSASRCKSAGYCDWPASEALRAFADELERIVSK